MMLVLTSLANEYLSTNEISKRNGMVRGDCIHVGAMPCYFKYASIWHV